jgi:hypothetical protein
MDQCCQIRRKSYPARDPYFVHQTVLAYSRARLSEAATEAERASYFGRVLDVRLVWGSPTGQGKRPNFRADLTIAILILLAITDHITSLRPRSWAAYVAQYFVYIPRDSWYSSLAVEAEGCGRNLVIQKQVDIDME